MPPGSFIVPPRSEFRKPTGFHDFDGWMSENIRRLNAAIKANMRPHYGGNCTNPNYVILANPDLSVRATNLLQPIVATVAAVMAPQPRRIRIRPSDDRFRKEVLPT